MASKFCKYVCFALVAFFGVATAGDRITVGMIPMAKNDPYYFAVHEGANEAAKELNVELLYDGPLVDDAKIQNDIVEAWITKKIDVLAMNPVNPDAAALVMNKAQDRGMKVISFDADGNPGTRSFFVNQVSYQDIGYSLADEGAKLIGGKGDFAIVTSTLTSSNMNEWIKYIKERCADKYPEMKCIVIRPSDGQRDKAVVETKNIIRAYPTVKLVISIASTAVPGSAEALKQEGRTDIRLTGITTPNMVKSYVNEGFCDSAVLWNTNSLGYLTIQVARQVYDGTLKAGMTEIDAGRLGKKRIDGSEVLLSEMMIFNKDNINDYDF